MMMSLFPRYGSTWSIIWSTVGAGLHHQHHAARPLEQARQLLYRVRAHHLRSLRFVGQKVVDLGNGAVEDGHFESVVVHVEDQILSHHGKADEADITQCFRHFSSPND